MSNLDDAFFKAYAKRQSVRDTAARSDTSTKVESYFQNEEAARVSPEEHAMYAPAKRSVSERAATVVSSRSSSRAVSNPKVTPPTQRSSSLSTEGEKNYRLDEVQYEAIDPEFSPAVQLQETIAKPKVARKPLSEYLAEMRTQIEAIDRQRSMNSASATVAEDVITHDVVQELADSMQPRTTASPVYTYPERQDTYAHPASSIAHSVTSKVIDKVELRKLASASVSASDEVSDTEIPSIEDPSTQQSLTRKSRIWPHETRKAQTRSYQDEESSSVRDLWRNEDRMHRFDKEEIHAREHTIADHNAPANHTQTKNKKAELDFSDKKFASEAAKSPNDAWQKELSAATIEVVKSLSDYDPKSERSKLYQQAKLPSENTKARVEQEIVKASKAIVTPFNAEWEVDEFQWPFTVLDLLETQESAFNEIADHLQSANRKGLKVLALTSAERGVGKSTTSLSLAATMAHKGLNVALVDGDIENPCLSSQLNLDISSGWRGCLEENVPLASIAIKSLAEKVTFFPLMDSLSAQEFEKHQIKINHILRRIARSFDLVIVDCQRLNHKSPQLVGTGEDGVLDAALVVVDTELSVRDRVETTLQLLEEQKITSIGIVENFASLNEAQKAS